MKRPRVGVSACLFGQAVRFDGTDRRFVFVTRTLGRRFELVPVCPEVEIGLGVPRETIRLEGDPRAPRLIANDSGRELTATMTRWAARRSADLARLGLAGFVFKNHSPSCGPRRVQVWSEGSTPARRDGVGLFARAVREALPRLPVEDEASLVRPGQQARFIRRVEAYARWCAFAAGQPSPAALRAFHRAERALRRSRGGRSERELSRLVGQFEARGGRRFLLEYGDLHLDALAGRPGRRGGTTPR